MMISKEYWTCLIRSTSLIIIISACCWSLGIAQEYYTYQQFVPQNYSLKKAFQDSTQKPQYPDPNKVLKRSLMIPGWGQVTNKQAWKVPLVYGLMGGLTYYSVHLHKKYHDYRAAYYNLNPETPDDNRFGATPGYISQSADIRELRQVRNYYRNRRDLVYVFIGLSYALNAIDAYVFAHLRSFDVSDDLSMNAEIKPELIATQYSDPVPALSISLNF